MARPDASSGLCQSHLRIAPVSAYVARSLAPYPWLKNRIRILENPLLEPLEPTEGEPEGRFTVGFVGQLEPRKRAPDLARGIPVVAARRGALPEVLADAALFHEPENPASLAKQLETLRNSPSLRRELREKGLKRVEAFRFEGWLDTVELILEETVPKRGTG